MLDLMATGLKALQYTAALLAAGTALAHASMAAAIATGGDALARRALRWSGLSTVLLAAMSSAMLVMRLGGYWDLPTLSAIFYSYAGMGLALQCAGGAALAVGVYRGMAVLPAVLIVCGLSISGHSAALGAIQASVTAIHLGAASWWLGSLVLLLAASLQMPREQFQIFLDRFSMLALWIVCAAFTAGGITAGMLLTFKPDFEKPYDQTLLAKAGLACMALAIAAVNRVWLGKRLDQRHRFNWLRAAILAEIVILACVLATTAYLTTYFAPQ